MSARIYIHPRSSELFTVLVLQFISRGYSFHTTLRGHIEVRAMPNVTHFQRSILCPMP